MKNEIMKNIIKTIMDGLKDAQMQYEYAEDAKNMNEPSFAKAHIAEAQRRMEYVQEWWRHADEMGKNEPMYTMLMEHYKGWCRQLRQDIEDFKM